MEQAMDKTVVVEAPADRVDAMIQEVADRHGLEVSALLGAAEPTRTAPAAAPTVVADDELAARLRSIMQTG
jgi:hypothetical protein